MRPYIYMSINYKFFQNARKDAEIEAVKHELTHVLRALAVAEDMRAFDRLTAGFPCQVSYCLSYTSSLRPLPLVA